MLYIIVYILFVVEHFIIIIDVYFLVLLNLNVKEIKIAFINLGTYNQVLGKEKNVVLTIIYCTMGHRQCL